MMHLMVNRRQVPGRKKRSTVNEPLNAGLANFVSDKAEFDTHKPQQNVQQSIRGYRNLEPECQSYSNSFGNESGRAELRKSFSDAGSSTKVDVRGVEEASGECGNGSSPGTSKRVSIDGNRRNRRIPSETKQLEDIRLGPTLSTSLSFKEDREVLPEKLRAHDSTDKFAYISLDGRLINAELATSVASIGGRLGEEEAQAWEDFAPIQRVLIVAVSAAAAAAAKHKNRKEIDRLLKAVASREEELIFLRQKLDDLCKESNSSCNVKFAREYPEPLPSIENLDVRSPKTPGRRDVAIRLFKMDNANLKVDPHEAWSSTKPKASQVQSDLRVGVNDEVTDDTLRRCRDSPINKDVAFVESPCQTSSKSPIGDEAWDRDETKWYVNPMVETPENYYDISTPEGRNSMFSTCKPAVEGSFEWTVLRSSFSCRDNDSNTRHLQLLRSPVSSSLETAVGYSRQQFRPHDVDENALLKEHKAMRALCAAVVLDLRKKMLTVVDKEASKVMAALDTSVEEAKNQIAAMHLAVASCWNASVPNALAALSLSPSEFDSYLLNDVQGTSSWNDISKIEESIRAWRQYLEKNYGANVLFEDGKDTRNFCRRAVTVCGVDDRWSNVCPGDGAQNREINLREESKYGGFESSDNSAEYLADQLLSELDKAAAKVTVMESHMKRLEEIAAGCDGKLAESIDQDSENQVRLCEDVGELVRQLESKEVKVAELKHSKENHKRKGKTRKLEDENVSSLMATTKGYGTMYWERAAGKKMSKLLMGPGDFKTWSNSVMRENEPKALLEPRNKEIAELREDSKSCYAELDEVIAAVETTKAANANRIGQLEDLCRQKDSTISGLKQEILTFESKVQGSDFSQSPAAPYSRKDSTSFTTFPSQEKGDIHYSISRISENQNFSKHLRYPSSSAIDLFHEPVGRFRTDLSNKRDHFRNVPPTETQIYEELTKDGESEHEYDQECLKDYSSPQGSPFGDDCIAIEKSLACLADEEDGLVSEYRSSTEKSRCRTSTDRVSVTKEPPYNRTVKNQMMASSELYRAMTSSTSSIRGLTRVKANRMRIPAGFKTASGVKYSAKSAFNTASNEKTANWGLKSPRNSSCSLKVFRNVAANTSFNHRRASSLDSKSSIVAIHATGLSGGSLDSGSVDSSLKENSAIKRKRWL